MNIKDRLASIAKSPRENGQWAREALDEIVRLENYEKYYKFLRDCTDGNAGQPFICIYKGAFTQWTGVEADREINAAIDQQDKKEDWLSINP